MIIYKATNKLNQRAYIGKTERTLHIRTNEHLRDARRDNITSYFHRALKKYGIDNFEFSILAETEDITELNNLEVALIDSHKTLKPNGYNITPGGTGGDVIRYMSPEEQIFLRKKAADACREAYKENPELKEMRSRISKEFWKDIAQDESTFTEYKKKVSEGLKECWKTKTLSEEDRLVYSTGQKKRFDNETEEEKVKRIENAKKASGIAKEWKLTYPDGTVKIVRSIYDHCKENNLPYNIIYNCHRGKRKDKRGWNLEDVNS
jgi:group I intron endonuclease